MRVIHRLLGVSVVASVALESGLAFAQAGATVKVASIDPLSGAVAAAAAAAAAAISDAKNPHNVEKTGFNFQEVRSIAAYVASTPTSCQMKRLGA